MRGETVTFGQSLRNLREKLRRDDAAPSVGQTVLALHLLDPQAAAIAPADLHDWREANPDALPPCATETQ